MDPVIGLGTGRCGTRSLARFLKENGLPMHHEHHKLRWFPKHEPKARIDGILDKLPTEMEVAFYWLMYVPLVIERYPNAKFICLERDKQLVIKSYMQAPHRGVNPIITFLYLCRRGNDVQYYRETVSDEDLEKMDASTREFVKHMWDAPMIQYTGLDERFPDYNIYKPEEFLNK